MRYQLLTISILIVFFTYGQKKSGFIKNENSKNIKWAEYYSVNKNYSKAIEYFMKIKDSLTPIHTRLYSDALKNLNDLKTASKIMDPLIKSKKIVLDLLNFMRLLYFNLLTLKLGQFLRWSLLVFFLMMKN